MLFAMIMLMLVASAIAVVPLLVTLRATNAHGIGAARPKEIAETTEASPTHTRLAA